MGCLNDLQCLSKDPFRQAPVYEAMPNFDLAFFRLATFAVCDGINEIIDSSNITNTPHLAAVQTGGIDHSLCTNQGGSPLKDNYTTFILFILKYQWSLDFLDLKFLAFTVRTGCDLAAWWHS